MKTNNITQLLTTRRISQVTRLPLSLVQQILDEHPEIQPNSVADYEPVYSQAALRLFASIVLESFEVAR